MAPEILHQLETSFNIKIRCINSNRYDCAMNPDTLRSAAEMLNGRSQLLAMFASDEREIDGVYRIYTVFGLEEEAILTVSTGISQEYPVYPSITPVYPAAHWYEREIKDMFGVQPLGHPDPRRLVLHRGWPKGIYPLRKDCREIPFEQTTGAEGRFPYQEVVGEGITQVPVGPIHAGIIEPGHFRFHTVGESILELEARLFYTHRGIEKLSEGKLWSEVQPLVERICGVCTVSHSWAFAMAVEEIAGIKAPVRAEYLRVLFGEMERIYNHLNDISAICAGVGLALGSQKAAVLKEKALRLNQRVTGHRYLQGVIVPGGVKTDLQLEHLADIKRFLAELCEEVRLLWQTFSESDSFLDRLKTTGILPREDAEILGAVGPAARASGLARDTRRDFPYGAYHELSFNIPAGTHGDVFSRFWIRFQELEASCQLVLQAQSGLKEGPVHTGIPQELPAARKACGVVESPRGSDLHWLMTGPDGRIDRYFIRSASYPNWPALAKAVPGNIIPDFPLINKSFELCYSCLDR